MIANRIHWALTYRVKAGLIERPARGRFVATEPGRSIIEQNPPEINNDVTATAEEQIELAAQELTSALRDELPDTYHRAA